MPTKQEMRALENAQSLADANQMFAEGLLDASTREDVHTPEVRSEARNMGLGSMPVQSTNNASKFVTLYHAYEPRSVQVPMYMGPQRLTVRFPHGSSEIPEEYWGKQVWHMRPQVAVVPGEYAFQCRLSPNADEDIKAEMKKAGLALTCRKKLKYGGFSSQFEADEHFRVKHPRRWQSYQRFLGIDTQKTSATNMEALVSAVLEMAKAQTPGAVAQPETTPADAPVMPTPEE